MLKATELRIGNWVYHYNWRKLVKPTFPFPGQVTQISQRGFVIEHKWNGQKAEGIPITPSILELSGFVFREKFVYCDKSTGQRWTKGSFILGQMDTPGEFGMEYIAYDRTSHLIPGDLKYLHELQNLYFCLTSMELQIPFIQTP